MAATFDRRMLMPECAQKRSLARIHDTYKNAETDEQTGVAQFEDMTNQTKSSDLKKYLGIVMGFRS
jgi:hypothetical protein